MIQPYDTLQRATALFRRWRRRLATAAVCALALWTAFHVMFGPNGMMVYQHKRAEYRQLQKDVQTMQLDNERLEQQIKALESDPKAIEREAREQLHYTRPGEIVYVLPGQRADKPPANASAQKSARPPVPH